LPPYSLYINKENILLKHLFNFLFVPHVQVTAKVICSENKCTLCGKCQKICPENAIMVDETARIYYSYRCTGCKSCVGECSFDALAFAEE
jgi:Pyruvate/2-oxoacid:ferredoxin oxidoreductase delta subunit